MRLRLSVLTTLMLIIGVSTLFFTLVLSIVGAFDIFTLVLLVVVFNLIQWLIAPYIVDAMYRVKEVTRYEQPDLYEIVERTSRRSGIRVPRVMISSIPIPNAFAYSSPIAGTRIAVTSGLLRALEAEEIEAVIGHELGHIKHRDVQIMMFVSILPAILYYLGYSLYFSARYSRNSDRSSGTTMLGSISMLLYFVFTLLSLRLSRLREYYADRHVVSVVDDGARKLSEGLAKIVIYTGRISKVSDVRSYSYLKALFIADPDMAEQDSSKIREIMGGSDQRLVQRVLSRRVSQFDSFVEIFSTHPNIVKRLRILKDQE